MKKKQKSLWLSGISLATCVAMLAGTTFAWFSDTATSNGNVITSGKLKISVTAQDLTSAGEDGTGTYTVGDYELVVDGETVVNLANAENTLINNEKWEPGCVDAKLITVKNTGTLNTQININAVVHDKELQDALWIDLFTVAVNGAAVDYGKFNPVPMSKLSEGLATRDANILEEDGSFQVIAIYGMNKSAGNEYQEKSFSADLQFVATQAIGDTDGLGRDDYDAEAVNEVVTVATADDLTTQLALVEAGTLVNGTIVLMDDITVDSAIALTNLVNFDLNSYTLTCTAFSISNETSTETVDIEGGTITATTGDITVLVPSGSVNIANATIETDGTVTFNATTNTLTLSGTTKFTKVATDEEVVPVIMDNTRVVVATTTNTSLAVAEGASDVTVEDGRETTTNEDGNTVQPTNTITVEVPTGATVTIANTSKTDTAITTTGDGTVEDLVDGEAPVPTASEQFVLDLQNAQNGDTVTLTDDVTFDSNLYIFGKAISINLDGHELIVNGAFVLDYHNLTTLPETNCCAISDGIVNGYQEKYGTYYPTYENEFTQEGILSANIVFISAGGGNFEIKAIAPEGKPNSGTREAAGNCSMGGNWCSIGTGTGEPGAPVTTPAYDASDSNYTQYLAATTITIGEQG